MAKEDIDFEKYLRQIWLAERLSKSSNILDVDVKELLASSK
ncbi:MAG: hypothetical protein OCD76_03190 [Reichenbachiella sp.]